jgi:GNAT superfamily N-acetyltransferase
MLKTIIFFNKNISETVTIRNDLEIQFINYSDIILLKDLFPPEFLVQYRERFEKGYKCITLSIDSQIAHIAWIAFNSLIIDEIYNELKLRPDEICIFDVRTMEGYRGRGIYTFALNHICKWAKENGFQNIKIYTEKDNISSIKGILNAGFSVSEKITLINFHALKFYVKSKMKNKWPIWSKNQSY